MSKAKQDVVTTASNIPAHLQSATAPIGNENIGAEDLEIPRLKLLQSLSPEVQEGADSYVPGAKAGMTINTTTGELIESFDCINIFFDREYAVFKKRNLGGDGIPLVVEDSEEKAKAFIETNRFNIDEYDVVDTARHLVTVLDPNGNPAYEAIMLMSSTRLQFSKNWNSQITAAQVDRFGGVWTVGPVRVSNSKGSWFTYKVDFNNYATVEQHAHCKAIYDNVSTAMARKAA